MTKYMTEKHFIYNSVDNCVKKSEIIKELSYRNQVISYEYLIHI